MKTIKLLFLILTLAYVLNVSAQSVYTTKTGEKYHTTTCSYLKYSKNEITLEKAISLGYQACNVCKPTANNTKNSATSTTSNSISNSTTSTTKTAKAVPCSGKTKSGARCKRKNTNSNGRCYQH